LIIYWCALSATWCRKTFTIIHVQNIVVQKIFVRAEGDAAASIPRIPPGSATVCTSRFLACSSRLDPHQVAVGPENIGVLWGHRHEPVDLSAN